MDFKICGTKIGTYEGWEQVDDNESIEIQVYKFAPNKEFSHIPESEYVSFNLIEGTWTIWAHNGEIEKTGLVYPK